MGFANKLRYILAEDQSIGWSLFGFNVGLEAGQIAVVMICLSTLLLFCAVVKVQPQGVGDLYFGSCIWCGSANDVAENTVMSNE
jgi:hypothetical protein